MVEGRRNWFAKVKEVGFSVGRWKYPVVKVVGNGVSPLRKNDSE